MSLHIGYKSALDTNTHRPNDPLWSLTVVGMREKRTAAIYVELRAIREEQAALALSEVFA
jgi:hypothetical protein